MLDREANVSLREEAIAEHGEATHGILEAANLRDAISDSRDIGRKSDDEWFCFFEYHGGKLASRMD